MINSIINRHKSYKFDKIMIIISATSVLQLIDDYNLISLTDEICFAYLNHPHTDKTLQ